MTRSNEMPPVSLQHAQIAFNFILESQTLLRDAEKEELLEVFARHRVLEHDRVYLSSTHKIRRTLVSSVGKLNSLAGITENEDRRMGDQLRELIIADETSDDTVSFVGASDAPSRITPITAFESVRKRCTWIPSGCLTSDAVILPDSVTEIEQEAFLYARLTQIEFGNGIKKVGADAFLCDIDAKKYLYPKLPVAVFAKEDRRRAFYHFVHDAGNGGYTPQVYKRNMDYVRRHLLDEIEYKRVCIDVLEGKPDLLNEALSGGKIPPKDLENLIIRYSRKADPQMLALLLQNRSAQSKG
jgi:hypothetical protein